MTAAQVEQEPAGRYVLVDTGDAEALAWAANAGGQLVVDYGAFGLWRLPPDTSQPGLVAAPASLRPAGGNLYLRGLTLDTTQSVVEPALPAGLRQDTVSGDGLWIVQFIGPALDGWLEALRVSGLEIVAYLPENAYIVWGSDPQSRISGNEALAGLVQWQGAYHPGYRLAPELRQAAVDGGVESVDVTIQVYNTPGLEGTLDRLVSMAGTQLAPTQTALNLTNLRLSLPDGAAGGGGRPGGCVQHRAVPRSAPVG